ncbi:alpha-amylase family protein [Streptomonospora nanhaiensis]|uniref:alpha-amylase family protein n=1 Tax=Streptomonospora nanhaiensis TaxID=1323731 RepID=UPI001C998BEB|nr:alpha-amylase family protein [Streptomonospora nanhaiensis]MBX9386799.1 alpha-amylase family protein [Streptomonospora nanhaiensis]
MDAPRSPDAPDTSWIRHAIWWHVYPLGFCGAPVRPAGPAPAPRLRALLDWLDYAVELGVNGLLLGPVFHSATHGYDTLDHYRIDPRLGTLADFDDLVAACRARGLRVVLDGVFSHVGAGHPALARALAAGPGSPEAELFDVDWQAPGGPRPRVFEGHGELVRLDHTRPRTADLVADVLGYWLERGVDGWRLDAAYSVDPRFWAEVCQRVRRDHPRAWFLGEVIHGDYGAFVAESRLDSVTQYELWKALWSSLAERNLFELDWALQRHNRFLDSFTPTTFVGNHDVTRIASTLGGDGAVAAPALLMCVGGVPCVYYGDEQGFTGIKEERLGGDDAVRPAFPGSPGELAPWGRGVHRAHRELIGLRRRHPWLATAATEAVALDNTRYVFRAHGRHGGAHLEVEADIAAGWHVAIRGPAGHTLWRLDAEPDRS